MTDAADDAAEDASATKLLRRVGVTDAVLIGLGSMIGTGVFVVFAPAAAAAGSGLLIGLGIAAFVAYANATSSAELAAIYPASGGTYVYGRERLGAVWGFLAGIGFVSGKIASCAAAALAVGAYAAPSAQRPVAAAAVVFITTVNYFGITKTAALNRVLVALLLAVLAIVVVATLGGGNADVDHLTSWFPNGLHGVLQAAGLLFFAFAGYARIATLGEEVKDPKRTIPRAIPLALGITLAIYTIVAVSVLLALGPDALAHATAPLYTAVATGRFDAVSGIVRIGGALAALGVFLSLVAGISRTTYAMATNGDLPRWLGAVHPRYHVPHHAELAVGAITLAIVSFGGITGTVSFSAFTVLVYYAIANTSAYMLDRNERRWPRWLAVAGIIGCVTLAVNLPWQALVAGVVVFVIAAATYRLRAHRRSSSR
jgi:APA family basic amino acid/polyamine antiporter